MSDFLAMDCDRGCPCAIRCCPARGEAGGRSSSSPGESDRRARADRTDIRPRVIRRNGLAVTISEALPHLWASSRRLLAAGKTLTAPQVLGAENSLEFRIGPEHQPVETVRRSHGFAAMVLPALLAGRADAVPVADSVLAVLTELVDVTARNRASIDLAGRVSYDGDHVLLTVGEMDCPLPAPEEEPGLYVVHRLVDHVGQYRSDDEGFVTWASLPVRLEAK